MAALTTTPAAPRRRRASKRSLRIWAAVAGAVGFALPWAAIRAVPVPTTAAAPPPRVIVVPAGTRVVLHTGSGAKGAVSLVATGAAKTPPAPAITSGSKPPP